MSTRQCTQCKLTYPETEEYFYKQKRTSKKKGTYYGFSSWCKKCTIVKATEWGENNHDKKLIIQKRYNSRPHRKELKKGYNRKRQDSGKQTEWQRNNKDKLSEYGATRRTNKTHNITPKERESCKQYFDNTCAYCGLSEDEHKEMHNQQLHMDHVVNDGANDLTNAVPACKSCNGSKRTYSLEDWYDESKEFYSIERLGKIKKWLHVECYKYLLSK